MSNNTLFINYLFLLLFILYTVTVLVNMNFFNCINIINKYIILNYKLHIMIVKIATFLMLNKTKQKKIKANLKI